MATYAIGDVQGCFQALQRLLDVIHFDPTVDRVWFVGDLVNRGPSSLEVLRFVKQLGAAAITVLGNHDLHLLAVHAGVTALQRKDTVQDILSAPDCEELLGWLRRQRIMYRESPFLLVHAGILPQWSVDQGLQYARLLETVLQSENYQEFLPALYRCSTSSWVDHQPPEAQLGFLTNIFTRMRVCTLDGHIDLAFKGETRDIPQGYFPWFRIPPRLPRQETVIFGHWSALGILQHRHFIGLDGGCVWGRTLAALRLEDRKLFEVPCSPTI